MQQPPGPLAAQALHQGGWLPPLAWRGYMFLFCGFQEGGLPSPLNLAGDHAPLEFLQPSQRTPVGTPDLPAQACSTQAKARVFFCPRIQKSLMPEALVWGGKFWGHSLQSQGGASHQPETSCWPRCSLSITACHWAWCKALGVLKHSLMVTLPMVALLLALISFHQWGWTPALFISARIHWLGWLTRFGIPLSCDQNQVVEGLAGTLDWVSPIQVGWCRRPLLGGDHGDSKGKGVEGLGATPHSLAMPPTRKVVRSGGSVGSSPNSMLNLTCFFIHYLGGCSSMGSCRGRQYSVGVGHHLAMPHSEICVVFGVGGDPWKGVWAAHQQDVVAGARRGWLAPDWVLGWGDLVLPWSALPLELEHCFPEPDCPVEGFSLGHLAGSAPEAQLRRNKPVRQNSCGNSSCLTSPGSLCRPALIIHLASSWYSSWIHSSCHQWGSMLCATTHSPSRLSRQSLVSPHLWTQKWSEQWGVQGPSLWLSLPVLLRSTFGILFHSWRLHCGEGAPAERDPTIVCRHYSSLGVLFLAHWEKSWPLRVLLATLLEERVLLANSFTHYPSLAKFPYWRVTNAFMLYNEYSSNFNLTLTEWTRSAPLLSLYWTNNPYLPALMVRCELTYVVHILLILIKPMLHDKFKGLLQQASAKQIGLVV